MRYFSEESYPWFDQIIRFQISSPKKPSKQKRRLPYLDDSDVRDTHLYRVTVTAEYRAYAGDRQEITFLAGYVHTRDLRTSELEQLQRYLSIINHLENPYNAASLLLDALVRLSQPPHQIPFVKYREDGLFYLSVPRFLDIIYQIVSQDIRHLLFGATNPFVIGEAISLSASTHSLSEKVQEEVRLLQRLILDKLFDYPRIFLPWLNPQNLQDLSGGVRGVVHYLQSKEAGTGVLQRLCGTHLFYLDKDLSPLSFLRFADPNQLPWKYGYEEVLYQRAYYGQNDPPKSFSGLYLPEDRKTFARNYSLNKLCRIWRLVREHARAVYLSEPVSLKVRTSEDICYFSASVDPFEVRYGVSWMQLKVIYKGREFPSEEDLLKYGHHRWLCPDKLRSDLICNDVENLPVPFWQHLLLAASHIIDVSMPFEIFWVPPSTHCFVWGYDPTKTNWILQVIRVYEVLDNLYSPESHFLSMLSYADLRAFFSEGWRYSRPKFFEGADSCQSTRKTRGRP